MGGSTSKEEVVLAQNAAGGTNVADIAQLHQNQSVTNVILGVILLLMILGVLVAIYKLYKRCHKNWMREEIARSAFRRSGARREPRSKDTNGGV